MSAISRPVGQKPVKERVSITRATGHGSGFVGCITCGQMQTRGDVAADIGVTPRELNKFVNRQPQRPDVAARIRAAVARVVE